MLGSKKTAVAADDRMTRRRPGVRAIVPVVGLVAAGLLLPGSAATASTAAAAPPPPCVATFSSGNVNLAIPDGDPAGATSFIYVPVSGIVTDADVIPNVTHEYDRDLFFTLAHGPALLPPISEVGSDGDNFADTVLDDEAAADIASGLPPFTGSFRPQVPLSDLDGVEGGGLWALQVVDDDVLDMGTLQNWSVRISYANCDTDGDGMIDNLDVCDNLSGATASGCPSQHRHLSLAYKKGKKRFVGHLVAPYVPDCKFGQIVTIWKHRPGPDKLIGTAATDVNGKYVLRRPKPAGRYYATAPALVVPNQGDCAARQSNNIRVR